MKKAEYFSPVVTIFDQDGNECKTSLSDRMIAISMEQFKRIGCKI